MVKLVPILLIAQESMTYVAPQVTSDGISKVIYQSKDANQTKKFDALDWLAQLATHIHKKANPPEADQTQTASVRQRPAA